MSKKTQQTPAGGKYLTGITTVMMMLSATTCIHAQNQTTDSTKTYDLGEVVISGTRFEKHEDEVGRSVTVITKEKLQESPYQSLAELLAQEEGIYVMGSEQNPGSLQNIYMRGAASNHTVILIDGVRITDATSVDNAIDLSELSLSDIEKIEIVRGSHSTLYGSSAIGGVINITTSKNMDPGFHGQAQLHAGEFGAKTSDMGEKLHLNYTHTKGFYVNAEAFNRNVNGINATIDTITNPNTFKDFDRDGFTKTDLSGKVGYRTDKWDVYGSVRNTQQSSDIDDGAYNDDNNYVIDYQRQLFTAGISRQIGEKWKVSYIGGYTTMNRDATDDSTVVDEAGLTDHSFFKAHYEGSVSNHELQLNLKLKHITLVGGAGTYMETMTASSQYLNTAWQYTSSSDLDSLDIHASINHLFLQGDINGALLGDKWKDVSLVLGARGSDHNLFGKNVSFEINPSYRISESSLLFASYSTGFNAPALYRLYSPETNYISGITRGNKSLDPERSLSFEMGFKQSVGKNLRLGMSYFQTKVFDAIDYVYLWDKNIAIDSLGNDWMRDDYRGDTYLNIGTQTNRGVECNVFTRLHKKLSLQGNFNLVSGRLEYDRNYVSNKQTQGNHVQLYSNGAFLGKDVETTGLVRRPSTANISVNYTPNDKLSFKAGVRHVGSRNDVYYESQLGPYGALATRPVSDYTLLDLTAAYAFNQNFSVTALVSNITDVTYSEIYGYTTKGRAVYLKVRYGFHALPKTK
ncbi:MAG: TonB-dependent receptor [Flavobacteriales bacterium]|nr:TonB-dependent receptor [Flavobacteriales bacterium]MCB9449072.1 TonB-dependent receptor [Flavobacteriales bacterium]